MSINESFELTYEDESTAITSGNEAAVNMVVESPIESTAITSGNEDFVNVVVESPIESTALANGNEAAVNVVVESPIEWTNFPIFNAIYGEENFCNNRIETTGFEFSTASSVGSAEFNNAKSLTTIALISPTPVQEPWVYSISGPSDQFGNIEASSISNQVNDGYDVIEVVSNISTELTPTFCQQESNFDTLYNKTEEDPTFHSKTENGNVEINQSRDVRSLPCWAISAGIHLSMVFTILCLIFNVFYYFWSLFQTNS